MIERCKIANYTEEKQLQYERDMNYELDYEAYLDQSRRDGIKEGLALGRAEGFADGQAKGEAKGKKEGLCQTALAMLNEKISIETISRCTGLTPEAILSLV